MILDIRSKVLLLVFANYLLLKRLFGLHEFIFVVLMMVLFILAKQYKKALIYTSIFLSLYMIDFYFLEDFTHTVPAIVSIIAIGGRLMLLAFMAGSYLISTTPMHNFITGLRKWKMPEGILMMFAVMMRFFPKIKQDYRNIKDALILKGEFLSFFQILIHPIRYFESIIVPLMMSASRSGNDLIIATLSKGITIQNKATSYKVEKLKGFDYLVLGLIITLIITTEGGLLK